MKWLKYGDNPLTDWGLLNDKNNMFLASAGRYSYAIHNPYKGVFSYPDHVKTDDERKAYVLAVYRMYD